MMHGLAQPGAEGPEVPRRNVGVERGERGGRGLVKLSRGHGADDVGGKVPDSSGAPVDVLETAGGVVGHHDTQGLFHFAVPNGGHIGGVEVPGKEVSFDLVTKDYMQRILDLVGLDSHEGLTPHLIHSPVDVFGRQRREGAEGFSIARFRAVPGLVAKGRQLVGKVDGKRT